MNTEMGASAEGYADPTAQAAVNRTANKKSKRSQLPTHEKENYDRMVKLIKYVAFLNGYKISNWIIFEKLEGE